MSWPPSINAFSILSEQGDPNRIVVEDIETGGQEASIYLVLKAIIAPPSPGVDVPCSPRSLAPDGGYCRKQGLPATKPVVA
jgi:hypothetical protein